LRWQWSTYGNAHRDRRNLLIHLLTVPLFIAGSAAALLSPLLGWMGLTGLALMIVAFALQGRSHRHEPGRPAPFAGPADVALRILAEQWITFPRFVLSGQFARAWRAAR